LKPGERYVVTLHYRLPAMVGVSPYRLAVRKQAGTVAVLLTVETPQCRWTTDLAQDRVFICG
jgi:hypothetical protein